MTASFEDLRVASDMSDTELSERLGESISTTTSTSPNENTGGKFAFDWLLGTPAWRHTTHAYGFIPADSAADIMSVGEIAPDLSLRKARLRISLDTLNVADYPGSGTHRVLFNFYVQNHTDAGAEDVNFNATYRVEEGNTAAVLNYPIFVGVNPSDTGLVIRCYTVNVKNDSDEGFLNLLESETFKAGLTLATTVQPAIAPLSSIAVGMTRAIAQRTRNVPVQDVHLGLDFGGTRLGARLAAGTYIAVQMPAAIRRSWKWSDWSYDALTGQVLNRNKQQIPLNYFMIGISRI